MATLEVHDGEGRVQFVELARDHPVLFGTSVACDIVLSGEDISPVHGRIRWKKRQYRVEASPDAEYVEINGHKMTSSGLHQGDEMTVGRCRLFLLRLDEPLEARPAGRPAKRSDEERTRVLEPPAHLHFGPGRAGAAAGGITAPRPASSPPLPAQSPLERDDWLQMLGTKIEQETGAENVQSQRPRSAGGRFAGPGQTGRQAAGPPGALGRWFRAVQDERALAPGRERIVSSPLVVGLVLSLGLLLLLGLGLRSIIIVRLHLRELDRGLHVRIVPPVLYGRMAALGLEHIRVAQPQPAHRQRLLLRIEDELQAAVGTGSRRGTEVGFQKNRFPAEAAADGRLGLYRDGCGRGNRLDGLAIIGFVAC